MHFILKAAIPVDAGNRLIKGDMEATFNKILGDVRPEQVYFAVADGQRTIFMVVDVQDPTDFVRICEPLWLGLEADVDVYPTMTSEEFATIGPVMAGVVPKY